MADRLTNTVFKYSPDDGFGGRAGNLACDGSYEETLARAAFNHLTKSGAHHGDHHLPALPLNRACVRDPVSETEKH
jgi:hypothetical protein